MATFTDYVTLSPRKPAFGGSGPQGAEIVLISFFSKAADGFLPGPSRAPRGRLSLRSVTCGPLTFLGRRHPKSLQTLCKRHSPPTWGN